MVIYVVVIVVLVRHTRNSLARKKESLNTKTVLRIMTSLIGVMFLFGLTWLFGALTIRVQGVRLASQLLFAIFSSFQGFFIFVFFCVLSKEVRDLWKETLRCGNYKSSTTHELKNTSAAAKYRKPRSVSNGDAACTKSVQITDTTITTTSEVLAISFSEKDHYKNSVSTEGEIDEVKYDEDTGELKAFQRYNREEKDPAEQVEEN